MRELEREAAGVCTASEKKAMNAGAQRPFSWTFSPWPPSVEWGHPHLEWIVQPPLSQPGNFLTHAQGVVSIAIVNPIKLAIKKTITVFFCRCLERDSIGKPETGFLN